MANNSKSKKKGNPELKRAAAAKLLAKARTPPPRRAKLVAQSKIETKAMKPGPSKPGPSKQEEPKREKPKQEPTEQPTEKPQSPPRSPPKKKPSKSEKAEMSASQGKSGRRDAGGSNASKKPIAASDNPAFLPDGIPVSAKFKGAYCEADVQGFDKEAVDIRVEAKSPAVPVDKVFSRAEVQGKLVVGQAVNVAYKRFFYPAVIIHIRDNSTYKIMFNDGDERVLRRNQMVLKGGKHYDTQMNLDNLPLLNPDRYGKTGEEGVQGYTRLSNRFLKGKLGAQKVEAQKDETLGWSSLSDLSSTDGEEGDDVEADGQRGDQRPGGFGDQATKAEQEGGSRNNNAEGDGPTAKKRRENAERGDSPNIEFAEGTAVIARQTSSERPKTTLFFGVVVARSAFLANSADKGRVFAADEYPVRCVPKGDYHVFTAKQLSEFDESTGGETSSARTKEAVAVLKDYKSKGRLPKDWTTKSVFGSPPPAPSAALPVPPPTSAPPRPLRNGRPVHKRNAQRREKFYSQLATYYAKIDFKPEDGLDPVYGKTKLPLCVLYFAVERAGGYRKVSETETWPNVLSVLGWGGHMDSEGLRDLYHARLETFEYFQTKMKPNHQNRKGPLNFPAGSKSSADGGEQKKASRAISKRRLANMTAEAGEPIAGPSGLQSVQRQKSVSESKSGEPISKASSQTADAHRDASQPAERSVQKKPEEVALGSSGGKSAKARAGTPSSVAEKDSCVPADIINVMHAEMAARDSDTELYRVRLDNLRRPPSKMILRVLTKLVREVDNTPNFRFTKSVHRDALDKLGRMTSAFIHYHGWNSRHDEWATLDRLKVSTETKRKSMLSFIRNYNIPSNVLEAVHSFYRRQALKAAKSSHANSADGERAKKTKPSEPAELLKPEDLTPELRKFLFDDDGYEVPEPQPNMEFKAHRTTSTPEVNVPAEAGDRERSVRPSSKKSKTPDQNAASRAAVRGRKRSAKPSADATTPASSQQPTDVFDYFERESDDQSGAPKSKRRSKDPNLAAKSSRSEAPSTSAASGTAPPESTPTKVPRPKKKRSSAETEEKPAKEPAPTAAPVFPIASAPSIQSSYKIPRLGDSATFKRSAEPAGGQPSTSKEVLPQPSLPTPTSDQPPQVEPTSSKKLERQASTHGQSVDTPAEVSKKRRLSSQSRTESISRPSPPKTPKTTVEHPAAVQKTPAISPQRSPAPVHETTPAHANVAVSFFGTDDAEAAGTSVRAVGSPLLTAATFKPIAVDTTVGGLPSEQPSGFSQSTATLPVASPAPVEAASPVAKAAPPQKSAELFNRKQHLLKFRTITPWAQTAKPPKDLAAQFEVDDSDPKIAVPKEVPAAIDLKDVRSSISRVASMKPLNVDTHTTSKPSTSGLSTPAASLAIGSGAQLVATQSPAQASTAPNGHLHQPATAQMSAHLGDAKNVANPPLQHAIAAILNAQASPFVHAPSPNLQTGVNGHVPLISTNLDQFRLMAELAARQQLQSAPVPWYSVGMADGGEYNRRMAATALQLFLNANPQSNLHRMLGLQNGLPQPFPGYDLSRAMPTAMDAPEQKYAEMMCGMQQQFQPSTSNGHPPQNAAFPSPFVDNGRGLWSPNVNTWPDSFQPRAPPAAPINPMAGSSAASGGTPADTRTFEQWALPKNAKAGSGVVPLPVKAKATVVAVENEAPCEDCGAKTSVAEMNELNLLPAFLRTRILDDFARSNRMTKERKNRPQLDTKGLSKPARRAVIERRRRDDELEELRKANGHDFLLLPVSPKDDQRRYRTFEPPRLLDVMASVGYDQNDARRLDESKNIADEAEQHAEEMDVKEMRAEILREMQARQAAKYPPTQLDTQDLGSLSAYINNLALMSERERARLVMANFDLEMSEQFEQTLQTTQENIDVEQKAFKAEQTHYAKLSAKLNRHRPKVLAQRSRKGYF